MFKKSRERYREGLREADRAAERAKRQPYAEQCSDCHEGFVAIPHHYDGRSTKPQCKNCREKEAKKKQEAAKKETAIRVNKSTERCGNCVRWIPPRDWQKIDHNTDAADCHGAPPPPDMKWPETRWDDSCGVFKTRHSTKGTKT